MSWSLAALLAALGIGAELINLTGVSGSVVLDWGYWPPGDRNWQFYLHWSLAQVFNATILAVTYLTWNRLGLPRPVLAVGGLAFLVTFAGALWAGRDLGETESLGLEGALRTGGWYRYSRNPQYVCYLAATVAFVVFSGSALVVLMGLVYAPRWLVYPLAEEPWLREQYGAAYEEYAATVPRFLGRGSLRRLVEDVSGSGRSNPD